MLLRSRRGKLTVKRLKTPVDTFLVMLDALYDSLTVHHAARVKVESKPVLMGPNRTFHDMCVL